MRLRLVVAAFLSSSLALAQSSSGPQTARQALIEMFFGTQANHLEKHLPDATRDTLKKLNSGNGMNALDSFSMMSSMARASGTKFNTFDTGPTLFSMENPRDNSQVEITVERDDLVGEEDDIELAVHATKEGQKEEQILPFVPRFTFTMKTEDGVWRLNEISFAVKIPLADPEFLKSISEQQQGQNEQLAIWSVKSVVSAEQRYSAAQGGYACTLPALADANKTPDHRIYLYDRELMQGKKNGYIFAISNCDSAHFKIVAEPATPGPGQRALCSDESGTVRASTDGKATTCLSSGQVVESGAAATGVAGGQLRVAPGETAVTPDNSAGPHRVRVSSGVMHAMLISKVEPVYPKDARVQGSVRMAAIIAKDGSVQSLRVLNSASPQLDQAAMDAVKQWKYRPYLLNGEPVEVDTEITVNFILR